MIPRAVLIFVALTLSTTIGAANQVSNHYRAYETISRKVEDGNKLTAEKIYIKLESDDPASKPTIIVDKIVSNNIGAQPVRQQDKIWATSGVRPSRVKSPMSTLSRQSHKHNLASLANYESNSANSISGHQILAQMRPRTVESPALSVDSGRARSSSPSVRLANGIKKLFNVEEGHYTDIYDRIDKHKPLKKRKPAEKIDERLGFGHTYS